MAKACAYVVTSFFRYREAWSARSLADTRRHTLLPEIDRVGRGGIAFVTALGPVAESSSRPRAAALPEMATAVLILNEGREIEYANASAKMLFEPIEPIGCTLPTLFACCAVAADTDVLLPTNGDAAPTNSRVGLADGRVLDCTMRLLSSGGYVASLDDVTSLVRDAELAHRDGLTGLPNRTAWSLELVKRLALCEREKAGMAVLYVDLDRFKAVNDALGHPVGDALLKKVADRLRSALRDGDMAARLGGDEFAVIQSDTTQPAAAEALAARLVDLIGRAYAVDGHILHIGASVGIALYPGDGLQPDTLLKNADLALYRAKADGRGCSRFFEPGMDDRMQARRAMEVDLRRALALKQFQLAYQPQIDLSTDSIIGFEALLRWHHPSRGLISPADFIPLAEEIGAIVSIGEWVLRTACMQASVWPLPVSVAVNVSQVQFRSGRLLETVLSALAHSGLDGSRLELEITESALLDDSDSVVQTLAGLRSLGVRISMDDFGTGYSSLSYLQKYPFDKVKIDQGFVRDLDREPERRAIVQAIVSLATALHMQVTAEGVETPGELACVRNAGCHEVQGYLTGRPQSPELATALLLGTVADSILERKAA